MTLKDIMQLASTKQFSGQKAGIETMNMILSCKLDNEEEVNVVDFLQQLEEKGLDLNDKSYELLARAYAQSGNVNAIL